MRNMSSPTLLKLWSLLGWLAFYTPILVLYFLAHDVSLSAFVFAQILYSVVIILAEVPTWLIADKIGHKKSILIGCLTEILAFVIFLLFPNVEGLLFGYILLSLWDAFQSGSVEALLYEGVKKSGRSREYRKHFSQVLSFRTLAFALGTAWAGIIYWAGWLEVLPFILLLSLFAKLFSAIVIYFVEDTWVVKKSKSLNLWRSFLVSMEYIKNDKTLKNIVYVSVLTLTGQYIILSTYQPHFELYNVSPYFIGLVLTIWGLANAITMRYVYLIEKYWSLEKIVLYFNLTLAISYVLFSLAQEPWLLVFAFILLQAQYNLQSPIMSDYINDRADSDMRATIISWISLIRSIANTLWKVVLWFALTWYSFSYMLHVQSIYLVFWACLSYWLLVRCGCVYKIIHTDN